MKECSCRAPKHEGLNVIFNVMVSGVRSIPFLSSNANRYKSSEGRVAEWFFNGEHLLVVVVFSQKGRGGDKKLRVASRVVARDFFFSRYETRKRVNAYKQPSIAVKSSVLYSRPPFFFLSSFFSRTRARKTSDFISEHLNGTLIPRRINVFPTLPPNPFSFFTIENKIKERSFFRP